MAWSVPKYSKAQVDKVGRVISGQLNELDNLNEVFDILSNWRSSHAFPLNTFKMGLHTAARKIDRDALIAQRLKRFPSIASKLKRFTSMNLTQMQDIGGCRAVLSDVKMVKKLIVHYKKSRFYHKLVNEKNYIEKPKESGYRSVHLVYRYKSDRKETYNNLQIEIQIRSRLQHAWATAVETFGTFLHHSLKSSEGPAEWLSFFAHMGSVFAHLEKTPLVPGTPVDEKELYSSVSKMAKELDVINRLMAYGNALKFLPIKAEKDSRYYLLSLNPMDGTLTVTSYRSGQLEQANKDYLELEKSLTDESLNEIVLVTADSIASLRQAYPNYFLDTKVFLDYLTTFLSRK